MTEFKAIESQEELDKIVQERLARQKESLEKKFGDYDKVKAENTTLHQSLEDSKTKAADFEKNIGELNSKVAGFETANLRTKIALEHGLPYDLAGRLVGDDEESISADAERLSSLIGSQQQQPVPPLKDSEGAGNGKDGAYESLAKGLNLEGE